VGEVLDNKRGIVLVISGPSGSGKGSILSKIKEEDKKIVYSVSATTRLPRENEIDGFHYHFKTIEEFEKMIKNGEFIEWVNFCGNYYGTPLKQIKDSIDDGNDILLELEVEGAMKIKESIPESVLVFVMPPSYDELKSRISNRGTESKDSLKMRMESALNEIRVAKDYDYVIINDEIDEATKSLEALLLAEKSKIKRNIDFLNSILSEGLNYEG
jgi:guanylate kinase